jgi:hypothetical protein
MKPKYQKTLQETFKKQFGSQSYLGKLYDISLTDYAHTFKPSDCSSTTFKAVQ